MLCYKNTTKQKTDGIVLMCKTEKKILRCQIQRGQFYSL